MLSLKLIHSEGVRAGDTPYTLPKRLIKAGDIPLSFLWEIHANNTSLTKLNKRQWIPWASFTSRLHCS